MSLLQRLLHQFSAVWNQVLNRLRLPEPHSAIQHPILDLSSTLNSVPDLMFELDLQGKYWDLRALRTDLLVAPPDQLLGYTVKDVMPDEAAQLVLNALEESAKQGQSHGTHIFLQTPIGERWFELSVANKKHTADESLRFIVLSRDITERKLSHLENERLAYIDPLTELPNRRWLQQQLNVALANSQENQQFGALLFLDLDNFKHLNDSQGHQVGDTMLKIVAQRLRTAVRKGDLVSRWGGDEFIVMIQNLGRQESQALELTSTICEQLIDRISRPYEIDGQQYDCQASIGVNLFNGHERDSEQVIRHADTAMYSAKRTQRGQYVISTINT